VTDAGDAPDEGRATDATETAPHQRLEAVVHGRVQGVGFRVHVRRAARALGLTGWVANEPDRRVRCVAEGPPEALDRLVVVLREGPPGAWVERVDVERLPATRELTAFDIRSGWHAGD
jgi:acylphosphatase